MPSLASLFSPVSTTDTFSLQYLHTELQADRKKPTCSCTDFCLYKSLSIITILTLLFYYTEHIQNITDIISVVFYLQWQLKYFQIMSLTFCISHHRQRTTRYNRTYYWTTDSVYVKTVGCNVTISHYCHDTKYQLTNSNSHTMYILKNQSNVKLQDIFARLPCQSFTPYKNTTLTKVTKFTSITIHHTRTFI